MPACPCFVGRSFSLFFGREADTPKCARITHLIIDLLTKTTQLERFLIGIAIAMENGEFFY